MNNPCDRFNHSFPYVGANCMYCGINQNDLSGTAPKRIGEVGSGLKDLIDRKTKTIRKEKMQVNKKLHSEMHVLIDDVRKSWGETAKIGVGSFAHYLGTFNRLGLPRVRQMLAETKESSNPKRLFWWMVGDIARKARAERLGRDVKDISGLRTDIRRLR